MQHEKVSAIVLKTVDFGESDKILSLFSLENGKISATMKGVKKAKARLKFASEPFCFAEYLLTFNNNRYTVIGASELESFYEIRNDIDAFYCGAVALEATNMLVSENEPNGKMFVLVLKTLKEFSSEGNHFLMLVKFLLEALKISGFSLQFEKCSVCKCDLGVSNYFEFENGGIVCQNCKTQDGVLVDLKISSICKNLLFLPFEKISTYLVEEHVSKQCLQLLEKTFSQHLKKIYSLNQLLLL